MAQPEPTPLPARDDADRLAFLAAAENLTAFHRAHARYTAEEPLRDALALAGLAQRLAVAAESSAPDLGSLTAELGNIAERAQSTGAWLTRATDGAWAAAAALLSTPELADLVGERHHIIAEDVRHASLLLLLAREVRRAEDILERIEFDRGDENGDAGAHRRATGRLRAAAELVDQATELAITAAQLVHRNERRWRRFEHQLGQFQLA